jgi:class 3 adenylate cyclase
MELLGHLKQAHNFKEKIQLIKDERTKYPSSGLVPEIIHDVRLANAYLYAGRLVDAEKHFNKAIADIQARLGECSKDPVQEQSIHVCALIGMFNQAVRARGIMQATTYFNRANDISDTCIDSNDGEKHSSLLESSLPLRLFRDIFYGNMLSYTGNNTEAISLLADAFEKTKGHDEHPPYIVLATALLNALALAKLRIRDYSAAMDHINNSIVLARQVKYVCGEAEALRLKGIIHSTQHQLPEAILNLNEAYELNESLQYSYGIVKSLVSLGINYGYSGAEPKHSEYCFRGALQIARKCGFNNEEGSIYSKMGDIFMMEGRYDQAEKYYQKDFKLTSPDGSARRRAYVFRNLGRIRQIQNKLNPAISDLEQALELFESVEDRTNASHVYLRLCQCLLEKGLIEKARSLERKARETFGYGETFESALCDMMLGSIYRSDEKPEAACQILEKSLNVQKKFPPAYAGLNTRMELALAYRDLNDHILYKRLLKETIQLARHMRMQDIEEKALEMLKIEDEDEWVRMRNIVFLGVTSDSQKDKLIDVTVMFVDIRNYTVLTEHTEVKILAKFVNEFFNNVSRIVYSWNGFVNKYIGDCVMSIFGLYEEDEIGEDGDYHKKAAYSALMAANEICQSVKRLRRRYEFPHEVEVGIGIASGPVVAGYFGSRERMEFSVIGSTVNLASRLQNHSSLGLGIICSNTSSLLGDLPGIVDHQNVRCKGFDEPVSVKGIKYELIRPKKK